MKQVSCQYGNKNFVYIMSSESHIDGLGFTKLGDLLKTEGKTTTVLWLMVSVDSLVDGRGFTKSFW